MPIWIDAVCINQEDLDERASQVKIMTWIYGCAHQVFVWLGKPVAHLAQAKQLLWALKKHDVSELHEYQPKKPEDLKNTSVFLASSASSREAWIALGDLFSRAWFGRIWVVQEVVFGGTAKIYFGDELIKYKHIDHFAECYEHSWWVQHYLHRVFDHHDLHLPADEAKVARIRENMYAVGHIQQSNERLDVGLSYDYFNMLMFSKAFDAGDPRDKIYALWGLCTRIDNIGMPDYGIDAAALYPDIFAITLAESGTMPFSLHTPREISEKIHKLPSWCPDYSAKDYYTADFTATHAAGHTAGHAWKRGINIRRAADNRRKLGVRIAPVDHIALVGESMDEFLTSGKCPMWIKILSCMPDTYKKKQQSCIDVFWRIWVRDREWREYEARPIIGQCFASWLVVQVAKTICRTPEGEQRAAITSSFMESFKELSRIDTTGLLPRPDELESYLGLSRPADTTAITPISRRTQSEGVERERYWHYDDQSPRVRDKFFITKDGYVGIGPCTMREGDLMCIFCGAPSCFVIRVSEDHEGCYELVGPAYVHGLMDEEEVKDMGFGVMWTTFV
jgi:hypothetical protein